MTLVSPSQSAAGDEIKASSINSPINQIAAVVNGNIDDTNVSGISGSKISAGTVTSATLGNAAVTPSKLALGGAEASNNTASTSAVQTYFAPTGAPAVTTTIGANGQALVTINGYMSNNTAFSIIYLSFAISGATTRAASDAYSTIYQTFGANALSQQGATFLVTGLAAGSTTFTFQARTNSNTASYGQKYIAVVPL